MACAIGVFHFLGGSLRSRAVRDAGAGLRCAPGFLQQRQQLTDEVVLASIYPVVLSLPLQGIMAVIYIGVFGTVVGYVFFLNAVQRLGSATAALFFNLIPVCAALTAVIMGQKVTAVQVGGMAIVLCGLMLPQLLKLLRPGTAVQPCQNS